MSLASDIITAPDWPDIITKTGAALAVVIGAFFAGLMGLKKLAVPALRKATDQAIIQNTLEHNVTASKIDSNKDEIMKKLDSIDHRLTAQNTKIKDLTEGHDVLFNMIATIDEKVTNSGNTSRGRAPKRTPIVVSKGN